MKGGQGALSTWSPSVGFFGAQTGMEHRRRSVVGEGSDGGQVANGRFENLPRTG